MPIHLYTVCWNEADILGFFFRHYDSWVDQYFVYDNGSTDGSLALLAAHPKVTLRHFPRSHPDSFVESQRTFQNDVWKQSCGQAEWVVVTAIDEHLHIAGGTIQDYLTDCRTQGVTLVPGIGFQMLSDAFPEPGEWLCQTRTIGAPFGHMNKLSLFNPDALSETGFNLGRHLASPVGDLRLPARDELMVLHYKYMGFQRTIARQKALGLALGPDDVARDFGFQYRWSEETTRQHWDMWCARAIDIGRADFQPWLAFEAPLWWRPTPPSPGLAAEPLLTSQDEPSFAALSQGPGPSGEDCIVGSATTS